MAIPTEPIGSIPRPPQLIGAGASAPYPASRGSAVTLGRDRTAVLMLLTLASDVLSDQAPPGASRRLLAIEATAEQVIASLRCMAGGTRPGRPQPGAGLGRRQSCGQRGELGFWDRCRYQF